MKNFFWCSVGAVSLSVLFCFLLLYRTSREYVKNVLLLSFVCLKGISLVVHTMY